MMHLPPIKPEVRALAKKMGDEVITIARQAQEAGEVTEAESVIALALMTEVLERTLSDEAERRLLKHIQETFGIPI